MYSEGLCPVAKRPGEGWPEKQEIAGFGEVAWPDQAKPAHQPLGSPHSGPINGPFEAHTGVF